MLGCIYIYIEDAVSCGGNVGVNDSKKLTEGKREELYSQIISTPGVIYAVCYSLLNMHLLACTFVFSMQAPFAWVFPVGSCRERVCEQIVSGSLSTSMCDLAPWQTHSIAFGVFICFCTHLHLFSSGPRNRCSNNWSNQHSTGDFLFHHFAGKFSWWCLKLRCVILHHLDWIFLPWENTMLCMRGWIISIKDYLEWVSPAFIRSVFGFGFFNLQHLQACHHCLCTVRGVGGVGGVGNPASNGRLCEQAHLQKDWGVSTRLYTCGWQPATRRILGEKGTMCCEGAALIAHCW